VKVNLGGNARLDEDGNMVVGKYIDMLVESNGDVFMVFALVCHMITTDLRHLYL
jgi:hypothetical protein